METKMSPLEVVAFAFVEPEYARQEYFKNKQKESGYSVTVFVKKLEDAVKFLSNEAHKNDWRSIPGDTGFTVIPQVHLYGLTQGRYNGSINDTHLSNLSEDIRMAFQAQVLTNETEDNSKGFYKFQVLKLWYEKKCVPLNEKNVTTLYNSINDPKRPLQKFKTELESLHEWGYKSNGKRGNPEAFSRVYKKLIETFFNDPKLKKAVENDYDELKENYPTKQF